MRFAILAILAIVIAGAGYFFILPNALAPLDAPAVHITPGSMKMSSSEFEAGASIPSLYTCDGSNINPPLTISDIPLGTVSLALIVHDPDVPKNLRPDGIFDHWVVYSIPVSPEQTEITIDKESIPGLQGLNGAQTDTYIGPCPPPEFEPNEHRYIFTAYALSTELTFLTPPKKDEVLTALNEYVIGTAELIGKYKRVQN